ncbi:protein of unknown function [Tenacibaculum sp. 190524A02b]|uniref:hypothetical protein n=1 Tax=Tenacibaculum vairaonense TaxID=3137860 RepID=UPI0032B2394A
MRNILLIITMVLFASCATGGKAIEKSVNYQNYAFNKMYDNAKKAMWEIGKVISEDRDNAIIVGLVHSTGVEVTARIIKEAGSNKLKVTSVVPAGRYVIGKIKATDRFIEAFEKFQKE